jgi:hypothetical protein
MELLNQITKQNDPTEMPNRIADEPDYQTEWPN